MKKINLEGLRLKAKYKQKGLSVKQTSTINNVVRMAKNEIIDTPRVNEVKSIINKEKNMEQLNKKMKTAEMKAIQLIFVIPLLTTAIATFQLFSVTGIWEWTSIINVIAWVIAPSALAWLKSNYDTEKKQMKIETDETIALLKNENQGLQTDSKLKNQEITFLRNGTL